MIRGDLVPENPSFSFINVALLAKLNSQLWHLKVSILDLSITQRFKSSLV